MANRRRDRDAEPMDTITQQSSLVSPVIQSSMSRESTETEVSVRDLRNRGGHVLERVVRGETLTVTRDGAPIAELRPILRQSLPAAELIARARRAPAVDAERLRRDIDAVVDQSL